MLFILVTRAVLKLVTSRLVKPEQVRNMSLILVTADVSHVPAMNDVMLVQP